MVRIGSFFEEVVVAGLISSRSLQDNINSSSSSSSSTDPADAQDYDDNVFSTSQKNALAWTGRIAGMLSFIGGIYMFRMAWQRRGHLYHRLMFALSIHVLIWSSWKIYGAAAAPYDETDTGDYPHGTTATCTAQGFFVQLAMTIPLYYVFLSCYSWVVIIGSNFNPLRYQWIEKYIHIGVHIFPIGSAFFLLYKEAFNSMGPGLQCYIASIPFGCGDESDIECTRGPQSTVLYLWVFSGIPGLLFMLVPTISMIALARFAHRRNKKGDVPCGITVWAITKQSTVYLGALYVTFIPLFINNALAVHENKTIFGVSLVMSVLAYSMGMWFALVYRYFSNTGALVDINKFGAIRTRTLIRRERLPTTTTTKTQESINTAKTSTATGTSTERTSVEGTTRSAVEENENYQEKKDNSSNDDDDDDDGEQTSTSTNHLFSINIFDGTAPVNKSRFSEFIFDGDDDDEDDDKTSTRYWAGCQNA